MATAGAGKTKRKSVVLSIMQGQARNIDQSVSYTVICEYGVGKSTVGDIKRTVRKSLILSGNGCKQKG